MTHSVSVFLSKFSWDFQSAKKIKFSMLAIVCMVAVLTAITVFLKPIYINSTESAPRGVYMVVPGGFYESGDYVIVSCPEDYPPLASKGKALLKTVRAFPGETYTVTDHELIIQDTSYPISHFPYLPQITPGVYTVPEGMLLCINDSPISFDSRYIGPVKLENIQRKVVLLINYDALDHIVTKIYRFLHKEVPYAAVPNEP